MKNEINSTQKKIWLIAGVIAALSISYVFNVFIAYTLLNSITNLSFSLNFFPPRITLTSVHVQSSFSLFLYLLYDLLLILIEIELLLPLSKKIPPPVKFGLLSIVLSLVGVLLLRFVYNAIILVFIKGTGGTAISLLYLFYSWKEILVFLFFSFLILFGYLTYVINRIKNLLETFPKEEENVVTKK
ncbi:MAG: hypothetical protein WCS69_07235 [Ignavibacteriaceae bacterium]